MTFLRTIVVSFVAAVALTPVAVHLTSARAVPAEPVIETAAVEFQPSAVEAALPECRKPVRVVYAGSVARRPASRVAARSCVEAVSARFHLDRRNAGWLKNG